MLFSNNSTAN